MSVTLFTNSLNFNDHNLEDTNQPIKRRTLIMDAVSRKTSSVNIVVNDLIDLTWLTNIHDASYLLFLKDAYDSLIIARDLLWGSAQTGLVPHQFRRFLPNKETPIYKLSSYYGSDYMTPIYDDTYNNAMVSANQAYKAAEYINDNPETITYVITSSPGHHAKYDQYGGYCFINNGLVAAYRLSELNCNKKNIVILDLDYHAGNGTAELICNDPKLDNIKAISLHCDPKYDYPSYEGYESDCGINYVLPPHCDWITYKSTLQRACENMFSSNVDWLIIAFGGDTFHNDPDASNLGKFSLEVDNYLEMGKIIRSYFKKVPILITQEGGYDMDNISDIVTNFIKGLNTL